MDLAEKVREQTPQVIARETHAERDVPAWMDAYPERGGSSVHQLPTRPQIVIDVSEQLIVELYHK